MRAVRFEDPGARVVDAPVPDGDGVLVHVASVGICGTDVAVLAAGASPVVPGHEIAGTTEDGTHVAVQPNLPCGACASCAAGESQRCPQSMGLFLGVSNLDGGFAERVSVSAAMLHALPAGTDLDLAALAEPSAVALHAVRRLRAEPGSPVLVIGGGTIGLIAAAQLVSLGHSVDLVARHAHQAALGEAAGARLRTVVEARLCGVERVLDTAGSQSAVDLAYDAGAPGARVVSIGALGWAVATSGVALVKEIELISSVIYSRDDFADSLTWLWAHADFASRLVTHHFALDEAPAALAAAADRGPSGSVKVLLHP